MSTPLPSPSAARREQRRRAALAGGGNLAADRGELLSQQHDRQRQATDTAPSAAHDPRGLARGVTDRSAIVWLPAPVRLGAGSSRCAVVGYVGGTVLPAWLATLIEEETT